MVMRLHAIVLLACTACGSRVPVAPPPVVSGAPTPVVLASAVSPAEAIASAIFDGAALVVFDTETHLDYSLNRTPECRELASHGTGSFTAHDQAGVYVEYTALPSDRTVLERCLTEFPDEHSARMATREGAITLLRDVYGDTEYLLWTATYIARSREQSALERPPAAPAQVARYRRMAATRFGVYVTNIGEYLFGRPVTVLALLDEYDLPFEWGRKVSGTLELELDSGATANTTRDQIARGELGTITDPELVAATKALPFAVDGRVLRTTLTNVTFDLGSLREAARVW
jgi:hypothetical protein